MLIAVKNLLAERARLATSLLGVAFAVVLVLIMAGIYFGTLKQVTTYIDHTEGKVWVVQPGVDQMFRSVSWLDESVTDDVTQVPGVESASAFLGVPTSLDHDGTQTAYFLLGYDPADPTAGPWAIADGRNIQANGETVMDKVLAAKNGIEVGDTVRLVDGDFTVVGLSDETAAVGNFYVFITADDATEQLRAQDRVSYILAQPEPGTTPETLRDSITSTVEGADSLTATEFGDNSRSIVNSMVGRPLITMIAIGVLVGLALITLTVLSLASEQMREFGILRAIGARPKQLYTTVIVQALLLAAGGYVLGVGVTYLAQTLIQGQVGDVTIAVPPWLAALMAGGTALMAVLGSLLPVRRVSALDPAAAFRA